MDVKLREKFMEDENSIKIMSSKSVAQRALICQFLGGGDLNEIKVHEPCEDVLIFKNALEKIRSYMKGEKSSEECSKEVLQIDVGESGAALRFFLPLLGALGIGACLKLGKGLAKRPVKELIEALRENGQKIEVFNKGESIHTCCKLQGGIYTLPGNISSQYVSGLLMVLPCLGKGSMIEVKGRCESRPYIELTLKVMKDFGVNISCREKEDVSIYEVVERESYLQISDYSVEGDWSNGAFFLAAAALSGKKLQIYGLDVNSVQGDSVFMRLIKKFGFHIAMMYDAQNHGFLTVEKDRVYDDGEKKSVDRINKSVEMGNRVVVEVKKPAVIEKKAVNALQHSQGNDEEIFIDCANIPDLVPVLSLMAICTSRSCTFYNVNRLRYKESDRIIAIREMVERAGGVFVFRDDRFTVKGSGFIKGGDFESFSDHRAVMMQAVLSISARDKVKIRGAKSVKKSYPDFFKHMKRLGLHGNLETDYT